MRRRSPILIVLCLILGSSWAFAQERKFEFNGLIGYTFSEGVDVNPKENDEYGISRLSPKSAFSFNLGMDYLLTEHFALGFNFGQEQSTLRARVTGLEGLDITDMDVNNFHGIFTYNFGDEDQPLRPYIFGGLGATSYSPSPVEGENIDGGTRFSTTWGGGVKYFTTDHLGFRGGVRWTPTHINSDAAGIWCSDYKNWGCWQLSNGNYSHQFELNAGIMLRF